MNQLVQQQRKKRFDEIHALVQEIGTESVEEYEALPVAERKRRKDKFWDCLWDWLIDGWVAGLLFVGKDKDIPDITGVLNWVYPRGTTSELYDKDITNKEDLERMIESEANRCFNIGVLEAGKGENVTKTWETMADEKVRDSHWYLEGMTIPFEEVFVTIGGDSAEAPGMFELPENNVNCRCWLSLHKDGKTEDLP